MRRALDLLQVSSKIIKIGDEAGPGVSPRSLRSDVPCLADRFTLTQRHAFASRQARLARLPGSVLRVQNSAHGRVFGSVELDRNVPARAAEASRGWSRAKGKPLSSPLALSRLQLRCGRGGRRRHRHLCCAALGRAGQERRRHLKDGSLLGMPAGGSRKISCH